MFRDRINFLGGIVILGSILLAWISPRIPILFPCFRRNSSFLVPRWNEEQYFTVKSKAIKIHEYGSARKFVKDEPMEARLLQFSVVVVGKLHNPTILNPDFLRIRNIVPEEWGWTLLEGNITTPALSIVRFAQGIVITVEHEKLQVVDVKCADPTQSKAAEIAARYVSILPHVRYSAVGINFQLAIPHDDPREYLRERFLKSGAWDSSEARPLDTLGLRFVYPAEGGRVVLSLDAGEADEEGGSESQRIPVIVVNANFHYDFSDYPCENEVIRILGQTEGNWQVFMSMLRDVVGI